MLIIDVIIFTRQIPCITKIEKKSKNIIEKKNYFIKLLHVTHTMDGKGRTI